MITMEGKGHVLIELIKYTINCKVASEIYFSSRAKVKPYKLTGKV